MDAREKVACQAWDSPYHNMGLYKLVDAKKVSDPSGHRQNHCKVTMKLADLGENRTEICQEARNQLLFSTSPPLSLSLLLLPRDRSYITSPGDTFVATNSTAGSAQGSTEAVCGIGSCL